MSRLATPEGTARYAREHDAVHEYWRDHGDLRLSSLGFGSYLGDVGEEASRAYAAAFEHGLRHGVNVLDTASVYRYRQSERDVGAAIAAAGVPRERFLVATKGGYLAPDASSGLPPQEDVKRRYFDAGVLDPGDVAGGQHAMTPRFLAHELSTSLDALGLDAVDVYFVHNPEAQLTGGVPRGAFEARLRDAFRHLEEERREGRIGAYGLATWNGFRVAPGRPDHLPLERILALARDAAGGGDHGFRAVELPYNLGMPEAGALPTQEWRGRRVPLLTAAREAGLLVLGSATLLQTRLFGRIDPALRERLAARDDAEAAIQFSRSTPGMTVSLVGTGRPEHAVANLRVRELPLRPEAAASLLG
jgi:aryl-alcohol dehydrogenase-like predicted oxidoreductase